MKAVNRWHNSFSARGGTNNKVPSANSVSDAVISAIKADAKAYLQRSGCFRGNPDAAVLAKKYYCTTNAVRNILSGKPRPGPRRAIKRATATVVRYVKADYIARTALLLRLEDNAVTGADLAFYALTDIAFCRALIWLHRLHKRVRVVIDRKWVRSCPSAIECVKLLINAGIPVRHRTPIMHYKLLILTYKDDIFVSSGSANLTTAAWNRNDELLVQTMGPPGYVAQAEDRSCLRPDSYRAHWFRE
ncbi:hypothetical protein L915_08323 [Phytophthora nicotianae]|uniref:Mitochondrial cardiolipin hydrolase n=2 Tax=Phytophthora nicotianae TaxID=4792 RepID=W2GXZ0_PHYNI|nr:hypothetical protein L915_08323 [Phytophthora nicotianae]